MTVYHEEIPQSEKFVRFILAKPDFVPNLYKQIPQASTIALLSFICNNVNICKQKKTYKQM